MNRDTLQSHILNGQTVESFLALFLWGFIGFIVSILLERMVSKSVKKVVHLPFKEWLSVNTVRFILSFLCIIIGVLFTPDLIGRDISNFSALIAGLTTDKLIEFLIKLKSVIGEKYGTKSSD